MDKKLGRMFNQNTMMYEFSDKSGIPIPYEKMREIEYWIEEGHRGVTGATWIGLNIKWNYEDKMRSPK